MKDNVILDHYPPPNTSRPDLFTSQLFIVNIYLPKIGKTVRYDVYPQGTYNLEREKSQKVLKFTEGNILYLCARTIRGYRLLSCLSKCISCDMKLEIGFEC